MIPCPRCGLQVSELHPVPAATIASLAAAGENTPPEICSACLADTRKTLSSSSGGVLLAQEKAREQYQLNLWKSRVNLLRKARALMSAKMYSEAAVAYEKYIKILELVFGCKKGENLTPTQFKDTARTSELTVVASVYWDLIRIYDSHSKYKDRQMLAAKQLALFIRFTPIFPDIIKRAEIFAKNAQNPAAIKTFLKSAVEQRPRCFIATAAFEDPWCVEVIQLRIYRDFHLNNSFWGRGFVSIYYFVSPSFAWLLNKCPFFKPAVRFLLRTVLRRTMT